MKEIGKATGSPSPVTATGDAPSTPVGGVPARAPFRHRLFGALLLFALVPTVTVSVLWGSAADRLLVRFSTAQAWERVASTGDAVITGLRDTPLAPAQRDALTRHAAELRQSVELARRFDYVTSRLTRLIALAALVVILVVGIGASRVAGHLSRQLSRPLDELVGWTRRIRDGEPLPATSAHRGAPEFGVLRDGMRRLAEELEAGRRRALEAERAEAFREAARRFAHELKNPLTPIRFAVARLRHDAPPALQDTVAVLAEEAARLEAMAQSFARFGRLPDGAAADVDVGELVARVAQATVPPAMPVAITVAPALPLVHGLHEPLVHAVANVLRNAVEASPAGGALAVQVDPTVLDARAAVSIAVTDAGSGIPADRREYIFEPYVTTKPGGTGLGLAIVRQTVAAHGGTVQALDGPGGGTTIRIVLPVAGVGGGPPAVAARA